MDQHREAPASDGRQKARLDRQADGSQLQEKLDSLRNTIARLHALRPQYLELVECAQQNIQDTAALEKELNSVAARFGLLPLRPRTTESGDNQRRGNSPLRLRRIR